jgi:type II secretory pathway component GspD/PulD (secretin)
MGGQPGTPGQRFGTGGFQPGGNRNQMPDGTPRGPGGQQSRGPDFFGHGVTDDPQQSPLYDPQQVLSDSDDARRTTAVPAEFESRSHDQIQLTSFTQQQQTPAAAPDVRGPRAPVTAEALEQLGVVVISGNNPADVEEVVRIIDYIQKLGAGAEVQIQLVPLDYADATAVANTLTLLYQRVIVSPSGNISVAPARVPGAVQAPGAQAPFGGQVPGAAVPAGQQAASVVLLPLPRFNAILLAAPQARVADVVKEIKRLDKPIAPAARAVPFPLKKASSARVAQLVTDFYAQRYPNEAAGQHQIRVTHEDSTNTVFVQAGPADLEEIRDLIARIDTTVSSAVNDVRIVYLRNGLATEISTLLSEAIAQGTIAPAPTTGPTVVPTAGALGGARPAGALPGTAAAGAAVPGAVTPTPVTPTTAGAATKITTLRFISTRADVKGSIESGLLEDIRITPDTRVNSLILSAPAKTMDLLLALIRDLDVPPAARAQIKVFTLLRADAGAMAALLQQLFLGTGGQGAAGAPAAPLGGGGLGAGGVPSTVAPSAVTSTGGIGMPRAQFTLAGLTPEGAPLVPLSLTVDARSNSLIIAGGQNDLNVIEAIISRLDDAKIETRRNEVFKLRNASAADVATTLQNFLTRSLQVLQQGQQLAAFQEIVDNVVIVAEPITNTLLISATPSYFGEVLRLIQELDAQPLQVVIQVLIAEVDLTTTDEFGVEVGLQSPVLFSRSIIPADSLFGPNGSVTYTNAAGGLVPPGVTVNTSMNPAAQPGFNFNNVSLPLGNNPAVNPGIVGFQGLNNLGVGRADASGLGGFVFSAASQSFNLLIRALKTQGRIEILSRPQIQTLDNQTALINVGQDVPYVNTSNVTATGIISNSILYRPVGVILQVTPRISPDGGITMRVIPEVSSVSSTTVPLGNGNTATAFNTQHVETTVSVQDGETVAIGGLITNSDKRNDNKIPWLGDLPYVGALFRYRTEMKAKTELLVILTPRIVHSRGDMDRILAEEAQKMDWCLKDVVKIHGKTGMEPVLSGSPLSHEVPTNGVPGIAIPEPVPAESLPKPRSLPAPDGQK